jgi:hypothetical protein
MPIKKRTYKRKTKKKVYRTPSAKKTTKTSQTKGRSKSNIKKDAKRKAKPIGWRLKGKGNYKKPTKKDIEEGRAYYEDRPQRSDVKRSKHHSL